MDSLIIQKILEFWLGDACASDQKALQRKQFWYDGGQLVDQEIREHFSDEIKNACNGTSLHWAKTPNGALALVILLDQFTRNIYRNTSHAYCGDELALEIVSASIRQKHDIDLSPVAAIWFYHPFHHSEILAEQDEGLSLLKHLKKRSDQKWHEYIERSIEGWTRHRQIIARFGRFPHRNHILRRKSTLDEKQFLTEDGQSFGQGPRLAKDN